MAKGAGGAFYLKGKSYMKISAPLAGAVFAIAMTTGASATMSTLYFDGISTSTYTSIPTSFGGFTWGLNGYVVNQDYYNSTYGNTVVFPSPENAAFGGFGGVNSVTISSANPFDFISMQFATWAENNAFASFSSASVTVTGYNGATLVGSTTLDLGVGFNTLLSAYWNKPVTELVISNDGTDGHWWLGDNFTFNASPVPEASTWAMMGVGFAGLAFVGYRSRRTAISIV
jgi:hypothetical protein